MCRFSYETMFCIDTCEPISGNPVPREPVSHHGFWLRAAHWGWGRQLRARPNMCLVKRRQDLWGGVCTWQGDCCATQELGGLRCDGRLRFELQCRDWGLRCCKERAAMEGLRAMVLGFEFVNSMPTVGSCDYTVKIPLILPCVWAVDYMYSPKNFWIFGKINK